MRDEYEIKVEIDEAQQSLEQNLGELKDALLEKVDVVGHIEQAIDDGKEQVIDYAVKGREIAIDLFAQARAFVRQNPLLVIGVLGGIALLAGATIAVRRKVTSDAR